jgi:hypothetical protein
MYLNSYAGVFCFSFGTCQILSVGEHLQTQKYVPTFFKVSLCVNTNLNHTPVQFLTHTQ